jgi:itaconate CoA-transferase
VPESERHGSADLPLSGVTVVALEQAVAAPLATRHLADLGARVLKVERPDGGDFARGYDTSVNGMASHFVWLNRGKESVALDLKSPGGRQVVADLVATADVFLQNLAPGSADRLGLGAADLRARHSRLVTVDMSGYGISGPYRDRRAYDMLIQCEAGLVAATGAGNSKTKAGLPASDIAAGMYALSATLAALVGRAVSGQGAAIEISMLEATAEWMGYQLYHTQGTGQPPRRMGLAHPSVAPYGAFPAQDGVDVVIGVQNDREWVRFAEGFLGRPDLATDPEWATNVARVRHRETVDALVAAHTARLPADQLVACLDAVGVATGRVNDIGDVLAHPQLAARDRWRQVDTPSGAVRGLLPPFTVAGVELPMGAVPDLGEHTEAVLGELGYSAARIEALRREGAISVPTESSLA